MALRLALAGLFLLAALRPALAALPDVFVRSRLDASALAQRGGAEYTVAAFAAVPVEDPRFVPPVAEGFRAVPLGERRMDTTLSGRAYAVREFRWLLVPERPGDLAVAGAGFECRAPLAQARRGADPSRMSLTLRTLEAEPARFTAEPALVASLAGPEAARAEVPAAVEPPAGEGEGRGVFILGLAVGVPVAALAAWAFFRLLKGRGRGPGGHGCP